MPFLWGTLAQQGRVFGNIDRGSQVLVTNEYRKSYPGYSEMLCGFASATISDNRKVPNPDVTVLEWLAARSEFRGAVAVHASWDVFSFIVNRQRSGLFVNLGEPSPHPTVIDRLRAEARPPWGGAVYDAFTFRAAVAHLEERQPRVLYIALNDTDEWAHQGNYARYLAAIRQADAWLRELWEKLQALDVYRGVTSLVITTDHGRGADGPAWREHGRDIVGSNQGWIAVLGPSLAEPTPVPRGEARDHAPLALAQVAATIAALAGENYAAAVPAAAPALPGAADAARAPASVRRSP